MADATKGMATKDIGDSPSEFLQQLKGQPVVVKLNSGVDYRGALLWTVAALQADLVCSTQGHDAVPCNLHALVHRSKKHDDAKVCRRSCTGHHLAAWH